MVEKLTKYQGEISLIFWPIKLEAINECLAIIHFNNEKRLKKL